MTKYCILFNNGRIITTTRCIITSDLHPDHPLILGEERDAVAHPGLRVRWEELSAWWTRDDKYTSVTSM